jgi:hypothetical protein
MHDTTFIQKVMNHLIQEGKINQQVFCCKVWN